LYISNNNIILLFIRFSHMNDKKITNENPRTTEVNIEWTYYIVYRLFYSQERTNTIFILTNRFVSFIFGFKQNSNSL